MSKAERNAARPDTVAVFRFSGATSAGGRYRSGGRAVKSWRRLGGSLSVMLSGGREKTSDDKEAG